MKKGLKFRLSVILVKRDGGLVEAHIPSLDLVTQGHNVRDALKMAKEAADVFFEDAIERKVLTDLLNLYGWKQVKAGNPKPPEIIGSDRYINIELPDAA